LLRRLDEAAIFIMIAGSYTPLIVKAFGDPLDVVFVTVVWIVAVAGAAGKLLLPQLSDRFWCFVYIGFGWLAVLFLAPVAPKLPFEAILLLASGGLIYTLGVPIYLRHTIPFRRAIWHGLVALGAMLHFAAVAQALVLR
jgi:hemolysin III